GFRLTCAARYVESPENGPDSRQHKSETPGPCGSDPQNPLPAPTDPEPAIRAPSPRKHIARAAGSHSRPACTQISSGKPSKHESGADSILSRFLLASPGWQMWLLKAPQPSQSISALAAPA